MKKPLLLLLPPLIGVALLTVPLLRDFHFESAIIAGTVGCFWAGIRAAKHTSNKDFFPSIQILGYLYSAAAPLFLYSLFTSCLTIDGVGFWILIPVFSVFFGTSLGRLIRKLRVPFPKTITTLSLLFCALGVFLFEFLNFPQVYFYNHVWGIWPGPIYDEAVQITGSLFYFRWITFLWIVLFWVLPSWNKSSQTKIIFGLSLASLLFSYINLDEAGIISPRESIQQQLGGHYQTEHFDLYFDQEFFSKDEIQYWALRHEFHFQQVAEKLDVEWPKERRIESYLYAHAWQKKKITGAKFTSYVPIWLDQDQLHIAKQQLDRVLKHELVHVISKQFGNGLYNGSWSIGLIEGLAEGIAKDASGQSSLHQIVAAEKPYPSAEEMKSALSFSGFYAKAGAISYTVSGSFVEYLIDEYPVGYFKNSYPTSCFNSFYPMPFDSLVSGWHKTLNTVTVDTVDREVSEFIFAQPSLFQKKCPHSISKEARLWDLFLLSKAEKDTASARRVLDKLYTIDSHNPFLKSEWVRAQISQGYYTKASEAISAKEPSLTLRLLKTDALFLNKNYAEAASLLSELKTEIEQSPAKNFTYSLVHREDSLQWAHHVRRSYFDILPDSAQFLNLNLPNKLLSLDKALQQRNEQRIIQYATLLLEHQPDVFWFELYENTIHSLAYFGESSLAKEWIELCSSLTLRIRYSERLSEQMNWINFLHTKKWVAD